MSESERLTDYVGGQTGSYRPGTVVRYIPDQSRHDPMWCREGMAIADDRGFLCDTFWGSGSEAHVLRGVELESIEMLFHLDDYEELDRWRPSVEHWSKYAPVDRQQITHQHRLQRRLFIRKGAHPNLATQIANAEEKVREAERAVDSAKWRLELAQRDLATLSSTPANPSPTTDPASVPGRDGLEGK